jgi:hypothetical protein
LQQFLSVVLHALSLYMTQKIMKRYEQGLTRKSSYLTAKTNSVRFYQTSRFITDFLSWWIFGMHQTHWSRRNRLC